MAAPFRAIAILTAAIWLSGCGYSLAGRGSFLPDYIKKVGIPEFTNRTTVFNLETQVTQKVRTEFIGRGRYQIVPESTNVDALLVGEIGAVNIQPVSVSNAQLATRYVIQMAARVELRDLRENKVLWDNPNLIFREEFDSQPTGQSADPRVVIDPTAFFGQDTNALDRMTTDFARSIVSAILEAF